MVSIHKTIQFDLSKSGFCLSNYEVSVARELIFGIFKIFTEKLESIGIKLLLLQV